MNDQVDTFKEHLKSDNQSVKPIGNFVKTSYGFVEVENGLTDDGDYVWHFSSYHPARPFPPNPELFLRIIKTYLEPAIPSDVTVDVMLSPSSWDKKVISVLARGIGKKWNFDEELINKPIKKITDLMTEEINRRNPRRTSL